MSDGEILELERQKLKTLIEGVKEAILIVDTEQNIVGVNHVSEEMLGYNYNEMIGRPIADFLHISNSTGNSIEVDSYSPKGGIDTDGVFFKEDNASLRDRTDIVKIVNIE